ncbi:MAG: hypothetical protein L0027_04165 [Candidatus Rokubacteria bacterium]|nr:hypothetical protein [Candidatus Rokubacteria bacterium]
MALRRAGVRSGPILLILMLLAGCASSPPATPLTGVEPLVGKWAGTVSIGRRFDEPFYLTVNPDGRFVATWGSNWNWGTITVASGQGRYQMAPPPREGVLRFYQQDGRATLFMDDLWGGFNAVVTKQS